MAKKLYFDLKKFLVSPQASVRGAMLCIANNTKGIALVVDKQRRLLGTITDGDIRRAILAEVDLNLTVSELLKLRGKSRNKAPIIRPSGTSDIELLQIMNRYTLRHIPLVDAQQRVVSVACLADLTKEYDLPLRAMVMAGGFGKRLGALTRKIPKPMLPVGGRPILERIIGQLKNAGIRHVNLSTHYKRALIEKHFGDGRNFGVGIEYVQENRPLGTAGAVSLLKAGEPLLVVNGDILTKVDFRAMLDFHREQKADMTVGIRQYEFRVPYGVIESDGVKVMSVSEKPLVRQFINAGIYLLSPQACRQVPKGKAFEMTDLINLLIQKKQRVVSFPIQEYWLDIGKLDDYERAQVDSKQQNL